MLDHECILFRVVRLLYLNILRAPRAARSLALSIPFLLVVGVVIVLSALHFDHSPKQQGARGEEHDGLLLVLRAMTLSSAGKVLPLSQNKHNSLTLRNCV